MADEEAVNDKWARRWKINFASPIELEQTIKPPPGETHTVEIELQPVKVAGKTVGYKVVAVPGGPPLPDAWKNCTMLVPRGTKVMQKPTSGPGLPLDAWIPPVNSTLQSKYSTVSEKLKAKGMQPTCERLEGDLIVDGMAERVRFLQLAAAVSTSTGGTKPLLVIHVEADEDDPLHQSGIAHAD